MRKGLSPSFSSRVGNRVWRALTAPFRSLIGSLQKPLTEPLESIAGTLLCNYQENLIRDHVNPLNRCGRKVFSQSDEDGITLEIVRRLGLDHGIFAEFGVGDGLENNTIVLASLGWRGFWVGGQELAYTLPPDPAPGQRKDIAYIQEFIRKDNIVALAQQGLALISESKVDVASLDLDGNDYYFVDALLTSGFLPKLFIVEYNAKFMPPIRWKIDYNPDHRWRFDDYFGASLAEYNDLFQKHGYFLACCNAATGMNAFFVHSSYRESFRDVPTDIDVLWSPPRYRLGNNGHPVSIKTVAKIMNNISTARKTSKPNSQS
jgi:hypothetical protein